MNTLESTTPLPAARSNHRRAGRPAPLRLLAAVALAALAFAPLDARAQCSCPTGGIPLLDSIKTHGNDLNELRGHCATRNATIELQAYQQHLKRRDVCPPRCPAKDIWGYCIGHGGRRRPRCLLSNICKPFRIAALSSAAPKRVPENDGWCHETTRRPDVVRVEPSHPRL